MDIAIRIFSFLFLAGVVVAGFAWMVGATSVRDRALLVAGLGLAGLVGLPYLAQQLAAQGIDLQLRVRNDRGGSPALVAVPVALGHVAFAGWLVTRRGRLERAREQTRERERVIARERPRLSPPDEPGA